MGHGEEGWGRTESLPHGGRARLGPMGWWGGSQVGNHVPHQRGLALPARPQVTDLNVTVLPSGLWGGAPAAGTSDIVAQGAGNSISLQ